MLRIKPKNISMQFIKLATLCMCYGLVVSLWPTSTHAAQPPQQPYYAVDAYETPGVVLRIVYREPSIFFKRKSGTITSIAIYNGQIYFCSANDRRIYSKKIKESERVVFTHNTYVRDIAVDSSGNLYFTDANGAKGDGRIYKLTPAIDKPRPKGFSCKSTKPFYTVELKKVDGFWAGDFAFDLEDNLYLSTGNRSPAFIYRVTKGKGGQYGSPRKIYKDTQGAIKGIAIDPRNSDFVYYADWKQTIHKLNLRYLKRSIEFSGKVVKSSSQHLSDVAFDVRIRSKK